MFSLYVLLKIILFFHRAILTYFAHCYYCQLDDFAIVFPNSVCMYIHLFMIIHKRIQAVEFLFSLIFCFAHVCMCVHVYFVLFLRRQLRVGKKFLSFYLLCVRFPSRLLVLATKYIHTYMCTNRYIWILNMEMSCLYVSVTHLLLFLKTVFQWSSWGKLPIFIFMKNSVKTSKLFTSRKKL